MKYTKFRNTKIRAFQITILFWLLSKEKTYILNEFVCMNVYFVTWVNFMK